MNAQSIGDKIERSIKTVEKLEDDNGGFDAAFGKIPIEIKGCIRVHKNGVNRNGKDRITKGRFWIDNKAHRLLLKRRGFYIFVIYYMVGEMPTILEYEYKSAYAVNKLIKPGDNTKIRFDRIFTDYETERV